VKPGNILISRDGVARIADFSIAKALGAHSVTAVGVVLGTPAYMSLEQAQGRDAGPESDVFSAGTVLFEMLEGRRPYDAPSRGDGPRPVDSAVPRSPRPSLAAIAHAVAGGVLGGGGGRRRCRRSLERVAGPTPPARERRGAGPPPLENPGARPDPHQRRGDPP